MSDIPFDLRVWTAHALLSAAQMRSAEARACTQGVALGVMMKKAGEAVARIVGERWAPCRVLVLCGPGNNGGDGYIAAEILRRAGWAVTVGAVESKTPSAEAREAARTWQGGTRPLGTDLLEQADLVVDALFGTGLVRPLTGEIAGFVARLDESKKPVLAVDLPSGVATDTGQILGVAVQAQITVTFFRKKLAHVLFPAALLCGEIVVADIGVDDRVLGEENCITCENQTDLWRCLIPMPQPEGHKYSRGHALIYGGAVMTGAARLAARAAQRMGAGVVTLAAPECALPIYAAALESVIVREAQTEAAWRGLLADSKRNALLIGSGLGLEIAHKQFVLDVLATGKPCVLDADALTLFADEPEVLFGALHAQCVLTPHEGEFSRLFGACVDPQADKLTRARGAARRAGCVVLLKGADTVIARPDGVAVINTGAPPWLATAGSGDVLAGMIVGLLAQGLTVFEGAAAAVGVHGASARNYGQGMIAEDIVAGLPVVLKGLLG